MLPLHWAVAKQASEAVVMALLAAHPGAAKEKNMVRPRYPRTLRCPACLPVCIRSHALTATLRRT